MARTADVARSFDKDSHVCAYWLARSERFAVRSGWRRGVVESVELDAPGRRARCLVVRFGGFRRTRIPADAVDSVVPAKSLLVVRPTRRLVSLAPARRVVAEAAASAGRRTGLAASATVRETRRFGGWMSPRAERSGRAAARGAVAYAKWLAVATVLLAQAVRVQAVVGARVAAQLGAAAADTLRAAAAARRERIARAGAEEPREEAVEPENIDAAPAKQHAA